MPCAGQISGWGHALQSAGAPVESINKLHYREIGGPWSIRAIPHP